MTELTEEEKQVINRVLNGTSLYPNNQPTIPNYSPETGELIPTQNRGELISSFNNLLNDPEKIEYLQSFPNGSDVVGKLFSQKDILEKRESFAQEGGFGATVRGLAGGAVRQPLSGLGIPDLTNSLMGLLPYVGNTFNTAVSQATDEGYQAQADEIAAADDAYRQAVTDASGINTSMGRNRSLNDAIAARYNINREDFGRTEIDPEVVDAAAPERSGFQGAYPQDRPLFGATRADEALGKFTVGGKPVFGFGGRVNIPPEYKTQATSGDVAGGFVGAGAGLRGIISTLPKFKSINPVDTTTGVPLTNTGRIAQGQMQNAKYTPANKSGNFDELLKFELQRPKAATALDSISGFAAGGSEYISDANDIPEQFRPAVQMAAALLTAGTTIPLTDRAVTIYNKASNLPRQGVNLLGSKVGGAAEKFILTPRAKFFEYGTEKFKTSINVLKETLKRSPVGGGMKEEDWITGTLQRSLRTFAERNGKNYDEVLKQAKDSVTEQVKAMDDLTAKFNKGEIDKATFDADMAKLNSLFPAQVFGTTDFGDFLQTFTIQRSQLSSTGNKSVADFKAGIDSKLQSQFENFAKQFDDLKAKGVDGEDIPFFLQKDMDGFTNKIVKEIDDNLNSYYETLINKKGVPLTAAETFSRIIKKS